MDPVRAVFLAATCLVLLGALLSWQTGQVHSSLLVFPTVAAAAAYVLAPQIRWWHWKRNPPDLPVSLAPLLERLPLYRSLDPAGKREFRRRTYLLREATAFQGLGLKDIPGDVKLMVAASAATATFHEDEFLIEGFENIVFYPHLFPTPQYDVLHSSELYPEDGVIIWTIKYLVRSVIEPDKYLQLGIYEYSRALMHVKPEMRTTLEDQLLSFEEIERLADFSEEKLHTFIGLEELDRAAITFTLLHTHAPGFARQYPVRFRELGKYFLPADIV